MSGCTNPQMFWTIFAPADFDCSILVGWLVWVLFVRSTQKAQPILTQVRLGNQLIYNGIVSCCCWLCCWLLFFVYHFSSALRCFLRECIFRRTRVKEHPLGFSIWCSYGLCVGCCYLFYFLHLFFFILGLVELHIILHFTLVLEEGQNRCEKEIGKRQIMGGLVVVVLIQYFVLYIQLLFLLCLFLLCLFCFYFFIQFSYDLFLSILHWQHL